MLCCVVLCVRCGHCKSLAPKYDELAKRFEGNDKITIAKVDATENDTPAKIAGFESQCTVLDMASANSHRMDSVRANTSARRGST